MSKGIVTEYPEICIFCGRQAEAEHHLIFGTAGRELSEKDGLKIPVCNNCHNMGQKLCRIHENPMAERLSKMLGQAIWEKEWISANNQQESRNCCIQPPMPYHSTVVARIMPSASFNVCGKVTILFLYS